MAGERVRVWTPLREGGGARKRGTGEKRERSERGKERERVRGASEGRTAREEFDGDGWSEKHLTRSNARNI